MNHLSKKWVTHCNLWFLVDNFIENPVFDAQKNDICKHCLKNVNKKCHSEWVVYNLVAPKRPACYQRGGFVFYKMALPFCIVLGHYSKPKVFPC